MLQTLRVDSLTTYLDTVRAVQTRWIGKGEYFDSIEQMRVELYSCGVTDSSIFPDLEGLSRELTRYFTDVFSREPKQ